MDASFSHRALELNDARPLVFTAMSKRLFFARMFVSTYVFRQDMVPVNPFMIFDYFLLDAVDRDAVRRANNSLLARCNALWVFGPVSDGVLAEIRQAAALGLPVRYFDVADDQSITPIEKDAVQMEPDVAAFRDCL